MAGRGFRLPVRTHASNGDFDSDSESAHHLSESPTLIHSTTPTSLHYNAPRDEKDDQRRTTFLKRRFSSMWSQKKEDASDEDLRGPLGLRLVFASPEPLIEIIFVHGLRGGSIKTWQKGRDARLFWPQHWLPMEPEFRNASVHSFGYDSDWRSSEPSALGIHEFGQALYEEMRSSPFLRRNPKSPIILVGHSMGGLVIKKAHILAYRNRTHCDLTERIRSIFFLATPHKGSDYAGILNNILKVSGFTGLSSSREYIDDLTVGSKSTQLVNDEFRDCVEGLSSIYSFYETLQTSIGVSASVIVDKDSAVLGLGYHRERVTYINANHGNICKFQDPGDSNYLTLKNALGTAVQESLAGALAQAQSLSAKDLRAIQSLLSVNSDPDHHYEKLEGSCQWIEDREDYKDWRDSSHEFDKTRKYTPSIYWVTANPGAGKTVLVAHVESQLHEFGLQHAAYYFHFGKKDSHSLAALLRSLAFQMARSNAAVRETLAKLCDEASGLDLDDARATWSKLFRNGIFQIPILTPQYWVIDALDECVRYSELFSLLKGSPVEFPLKIFITSRKLPDMPKLIRQLTDVTLTVMEIPTSDTMSDIGLYISSRIADLPLENEHERADLREQIIAKSHACFLWVRLVMDELEGVYGYESILEILQGIPEGMASYYRRTVSEMAQNKRESHVAKAILQWVALAARPLTTVEIARALELDVKTHLSSPKPAIEGLCGHLVSIDPDSDHVRIIHTTAREFLFSDEAGAFKVSRSDAHERIAQICLKLLTGPEMQPPRHRRMLEQKRPDTKVTVLLDYAANHFSEHIFSASASSNELLTSLYKFLSSTTVSWIDKIATSGDMHRLVRTARNLKAYLDRRSKYSSPLDRQVMYIDSWATDLSRLSIKFGTALTACPHSIYFLIPPLCPTQTAIYRQFRPAPDSLTLLGYPNQNWDDCIATLNFGEKRSSTLCCGENLIAVGFSSGDIFFYNRRSHKVELSIRDDFPANKLCFTPRDSSIAVWGRKFLSLWDLQGKLLWKTRVRAQCLLLTISTTFVMAITQKGEALQWDVQTGELIDERSFVYQPPNYDETIFGHHSTAPSAASISPDLEILALAYRNGPVCLFDLRSSEITGWAVDPNLRCPQKLVFNPNPDVNLLLVAYNESHLCLFDSWSGALVHEYEPEKRVVFNSITCSPSGQTFATVDVQGALRIWDFESLTVLYHVLTPDHSFRILEFTPDNLNLLDMTDHEVKVWSPSALVRKTVAEEASTSDQPEVLAIPEGQFESFQSSAITAIASHHRYPVTFIGKNSGDITAYNLKNGRQTGALYTHPDSVSYIATCRANIIASGDLYDKVQVWDVDISSDGTVKVEKLKFQLPPGSPLRQLVLSANGEYLLVSTSKTDSVYRTVNGSCIGTMRWDKAQRSIWRWTFAPSDNLEWTFALVCDHTLAFFEASHFPDKYKNEAYILNYRADESFEEQAIETLCICPKTMLLVLEFGQRRGYTTQSSISVFDLTKLTTARATKLQTLDVIPSRIFKRFLGISTSSERLVFLGHTSWVCSVAASAGAGSPNHYAQHFFVPNEYLPTNSEILPSQSPDETFIFCLYDKLAIVRNGLKFHEPKDLVQSQGDIS